MFADSVRDGWFDGFQDKLRASRQRDRSMSGPSSSRSCWWASLGYYAYRYLTSVPLVPLTGAAMAVDGDSIEIAGTRIRLEGIDAPELAQTCADTQGQSWACGRAALRAVRAHSAGP